MSYLLMINALALIWLHTMWSRGSTLDITIKAALLALCLLNGYQSYQSFEAERVIAASTKAVK